MKQITSYQQVQELKIGSILIQKETTSPVQFSILSCTPIGWEDIEFELSPVGNGAAEKPDMPGTINLLGSEVVGQHLWWVLR